MANRSMGCRVTNSTPAYAQPFPREGDLSRNINKRLPGFASKKPPLDWGGRRVFAYVLTTVEIAASGQCIQNGSAPNFQGSLISLCTCMHYHRTWWRSWKGMWIAGFCGSRCPGGNQLFYLMQVGDEYESQLDVWQALGARTRNAKSARRNRLGDVYEPNSTTASTEYVPETYFPPYDNGPDDRHVHLPKDHWKQDICFRDPDRTAKKPKLLVGDPERSFLWRRPRYSYTGSRHPRNRVYDSMSEFYSHLQLK